MPDDEQIIDPRKRTFNDLLADEANRDKSSLVLHTIQAFKDGEPAAIKLVNQALLEAQDQEINELAISDERFIEIINHITDNLRAP